MDLNETLFLIKDNSITICIGRKELLLQNEIKLLHESLLGKNPDGIGSIRSLKHSDLYDRNLFHSTIVMPPGMPGLSKSPDDQTEVHSDELKR